MADRIVVMNRGRIEQIGTPAEVFARPANAFVMEFLGRVNVLDAELAGGRARVGELTLDVGTHDGNTRGRIYIRPHDIALARAPADGALAARVVRVTPLSRGLQIELQVPAIGARLHADLDWERGTALALRDGEDVFLSLRQARAFAHDG